MAGRVGCGAVVMFSENFKRCNLICKISNRIKCRCMTRLIGSCVDVVYLMEPSLGLCLQHLLIPSQNSSIQIKSSPILLKFGLGLL